MKVKKWYLVVIMAVIATVCTALLAACNNAEEPTSDGSENGIYYYDAATEEYTLNLNSNSFMFYVDGDNKFGSYIIKDNALTFTFVNETESGMSGALEEDTLKVTYNNAEMTFLKKVNYTVSFESNGGSAVGNKSVVNGKSADKPADPVKDGYVFIGWYADAEFKTLYDFGAVKSDVKVYAQWAEVIPGKTEFTVKYDLGYEAEAPASQTTIGGKLYNVPAPERSGYTFGGWWVSQYGDGSKLSYAYADGMEIKENLTLYAVWKASGSKAPQVSIDGNNIKWSSEAGTSYKLEVTGPEGFVAINEDVPTAIKAVFANAPAGDYEITVTATSGGKSESTKLYYKLNALDRVSAFSVSETSVLFYNAVDHAEKYLITVECGNEEHNHVLFDNGTSTNFNFANCAMKAGGIKFTVTAIADGYASSVSESYIYNRELNKVTGLKIDEATQSIVWDSVAGATNYVVTVKQGEATKTIDNGDKTSISLKAYGKGEITVTVAPKTNGYNSPEASEIKFDKKTLAAPAGIKLNGTVLEWNAVDGAAGYEVLIGGKSVSVSEGTSTDLASLSFTDGNYTVTILAKGANAAENSVWSDGIDVSFNANITGLVYSQNVVSWNHVIGAVKYEVKVNGNVVKVIEDGANSAEVVLTKQGVNVIEVRYSNETAYSEWIKTEVYAHAVTFDTRSSFGEYTQYVAVGDKLNPPKFENDGYELSGWYNSPNGATGNGAKFEDEFFKGAGDIKLYANWSGKTYTVTYNYDEEGKTGTAKVVFGKDFKLEALESNDAAYVFGGWCDENGTRLTDGNGDSLVKWSIAADTTVYIRWFEILKFTLLGDETYSVSQGADIRYVTEVAIPEKYNDITISVVDGYAFRNCTALEKVSFYDTVKLVDDTAFEYCYGLKEINVIPVAGNNEAVYSSVDGALIYDDADITGDHILKAFPMAKTGKYTVPEIVTAIPSGVFYDCAINEVEIPASVSKITANAFQACRKLEKVTFLSGNAENVVVIDGNAFNGCSALKEINLSANVAEIDLGIFNGCSALEKVNVDANNANYSSADGVLLNKAGTELIFYPYAHGEVYVVPVTVNKIAENAFNGNEALKEIAISSTVTSIDKSAFEGCISLEKVSFANSSAALTIGDKVFKDCVSLEAIEIPARLASLGLNVFDGCENLANVTVAAGGEKYSSDNGVLFEKVGEDVVLKFCPLAKEGEYVIPDNVTKIDANVFSGLNITKITIGKGVKEIGDSAFANCTALEEVEFAEGSVLATIGDSAFSGCRKLKGIAIPATVTELGEKAFYNCYDLASLTFDEGIQLETIKANAFGTGSLGSANKLTEVVIPASVKVVENNAFHRNHYLATLTFEEGSVLEIIGDRAFSGSTAQNAPVYTEVVLPETVTTIGAHAFDFTLITSIVIPKNVTSIGDYAFANSDITSVEFAEGGTENLTFGLRVFSNTPLEEVTIAARMKEFSGSTFSSNALKKINVGSEHETYSSVDGVLFDKTGTTLILYPVNHGAEYTVPEGVTTIGESAFSMNTNITKITFPANIALIEESAFMSCSKLETIVFAGDGDENGLVIDDMAFYYSGVTSVIFPANLKKLGISAFEYCQSLTSITLPVGFAFDRRVFVNCPNLTEIILEGCEPGDYVYDGEDNTIITGYKGTDTKIAIPDGVTKIVDNAFGSTSIVSVYIPASVKEIGDSVFMNCASLEEITFAEDSQLEKIDRYAFNGASKLAKVEIPASVKEIGQAAFRLSGIKSVSFGENSQLQTIGSNAFQQSGITSLELPASLVSLGGNAFNGCASLESLTFAPDGSLTSIGSNVFNGCTELKGEIIIPKNITGLGNRAFNNCGKIEKVIFEDGTILNSIGQYTFGSCLGLTELVIPETVRTLGNNAFDSCYNIKKLTLLGTITSMGSYVFNQWNNGQIIEFATMTEPLSGWNSSWDSSWSTGVPTIQWKSAE